MSVSTLSHESLVDIKKTRTRKGAGLVLDSAPCLPWGQDGRQPTRGRERVQPRIPSVSYSLRRCLPSSSPRSCTCAKTRLNTCTRRVEEPFFWKKGPFIKIQKARGAAQGITPDKTSKFDESKSL